MTYERSGRVCGLTAGSVEAVVEAMMNGTVIQRWMNSLAGMLPGAVAAPAADSVMNAVTFAREKLGFHPDAKQEMVLDEKIRRGMLNCTRQWGKSTVMAVKALHYAVTHAGTLTLVISPSERQSAMLVQKVRRMAVKKLGL